MKADLSRDGRTRTNLRVDYRLDKYQIANLLAIYTMTYGEIGGNLSEKDILSRVRMQLMFQGMDVLEFGANVDVDEEARDWARGQVERFWKETV